MFRKVYFRLCKRLQLKNKIISWKTKRTETASYLHCLPWIFFAFCGMSMVDLSMEVDTSLVSITSMLVWIPISRDNRLLSLLFAESAVDLQVRSIHSKLSPWQSWCTEHGSPASNECLVIVELFIRIGNRNRSLTHRFATTYVFRSFVKLFGTFTQRFFTNNGVSVVAKDAVSVLNR